MPESQKWIYHPGPDDPKTLDWLGVQFVADQPVAVTHEYLLTKLPRNQFFEPVKSPPTPEPPPEPAPEQEPEQEPVAKRSRRAE